MEVRIEHAYLSTMAETLRLSTFQGVFNENRFRKSLEDPSTVLYIQRHVEGGVDPSVQLIKE